MATVPVLSQDKFIDQYTRIQIIGWAVSCLQTGGFNPRDTDDIYLNHAIAKGWVSKNENRETGQRKVLAKGFDVAAAFLKK